MASNIENNNELNESINFHIQASVQEELIHNGSNKNFVEIRNNNSELQNKLKEFNDYFNNNQGKIIEENQFEEGYNSRTGSTESLDTLLNEYKIVKESELRESAYNSLTQEAISELSKEDSLNYDQAMSSTIFDDYPYVEDDLKNIKKDISKLGKENQYDLKSIDVNINPKDNSYTITGVNSSNENIVFTGEIPNITKEYNENHSIDNKENPTQQVEDLQKLKSVELEKNVIGLLPKEEQENNYKDTLSRLDKNKSSIKDNLKTYMSNTKIDDVINSVKQHFENVKVKAEDIHKTFKDLGSWNTENKYVKNINEAIDKVKNIAQHKENKIDINDPDLLKKLETKFKESNDYINKIESVNSQDQKLKDNHLNYLSNSLEILNPELLKETNNVTESLSELSKEDKLNLYNHTKDITSITQDSNFHKAEDIKTIIETNKLTNAIENELGKSTVDDSRKDYLVSDVNKPAINENFFNNQKLEPYMKHSNEFILNANRNDLKKYQERGNTEINKINDSKKANTLKNNDLLQRYNKQNVKHNQNNTSLKEENTNEKKQQTKKQGIQIQ